MTKKGRFTKRAHELYKELMPPKMFISPDKTVRSMRNYALNENDQKALDKIAQIIDLDR